LLSVLVRELGRAVHIDRDTGAGNAINVDIDVSRPIGGCPGTISDRRGRVSGRVVRRIMAGLSALSVFEFSLLLDDVLISAAGGIFHSALLPSHALAGVLLSLPQVFPLILNILSRLIARPLNVLLGPFNAFRTSAAQARGCDNTSQIKHAFHDWVPLCGLLFGGSQG
jgi:hypothetical protein